MDLGLKGKVALLTGAAGDIGSATARLLAAEGAVLVLTDVNEAGVKTLAAEIEKGGGKVASYCADVTQAAIVADMINDATGKLGPVDILISNAATNSTSRIGDMEEADWDRIVDVALKASFLCTRALVPSMIERKWGRLIYTSSRSYLGNPGQSHYSAAKSGMIGFAKAMAMENGRFNITANAVAPGVIDTSAVRAFPNFEQIKQSVSQATPARRLGRPDEVANAIAFLASEASSYINGDIIHVTGGRY